MHAEAMILMDTECSGRYFDVRTRGVETFAILQELRLLCQSALDEDAPAANGLRPPRYPAKGKLVSLRVSIYAVDQAGAHGTLHLSPAKHITFKSSDELEQLIGREIILALKRQQRKAGDPRGAMP